MINRQKLKQFFFHWEWILILFLIAVFVLGAKISPYFLDLLNLLDSTANFSEKAAIALPMALLIIVREIDLSVASIIALSSLMMGFLHSIGVDGYGLIAGGLLTGLGAGLFNGLLVVGLRLPSIVVTIGTMSLFRGISHIVLGDQAYTQYPPEILFFAETYVFGLIPLAFVIFLGLTAGFIYLLHFSIWGRHLYAIGTNPVAAQFSGIPVAKYKIMLFSLTGLLSGWGAISLTSRIDSTRPNIALGWELEIITMVILGGVSIAGGSGSIYGVALSVLLMGLTIFALSLVNVPGIIISIIIGSLLIGSIALPLIIKKISQSALIKRASK